MLTDLPTWKNKEDKDGRNEVKAFFENQRQSQQDEVKRKDDEYVRAYTGLLSRQQERKKSKKKEKGIWPAKKKPRRTN